MTCETKPTRHPCLYRRGRRYKSRPPYHQDSKVSSSVGTLSLNTFRTTVISALARTPMHDPQHLSIPFCAPGRHPCVASINIATGNDPLLNGQDLLGLYDDPTTVIGYPILHASISSPSSRTYASLYGWVQLTSDNGGPWEIDLYPMFKDGRSPFAIWGADPTMVDAPSRWAGTKAFDWRARSFLCYTPDACMTKRVVPVLGFEWGFWIEEYKPLVKVLERLEVGAWDEHLGVLRGGFPHWGFEEVNAR